MSHCMPSSAAQPVFEIGSQTSILSRLLQLSAAVTGLPAPGLTVEAAPALLGLAGVPPVAELTGAMLGARAPAAPALGFSASSLSGGSTSPAAPASGSLTITGKSPSPSPGARPKRHPDA